MEKMRAIVATGPNAYGVRSVERPSPGPGEVLCRVRAVAVCGTDPHLFEGCYTDIGWPPAYPFIFGHEWSGEVAALGPDAENFRVGDRVAGEAHCGCGICENCRRGEYTLCQNYGGKLHRHYGFNASGAYAEYIVCKEKAIEHVPDNVSFDEATMCDTAGVALHGNDVVQVGSADTVAIYGPGPIGNIAMQIAKLRGARTIMVGRGERLRKAVELGADHAVDYSAGDPVAEVLRLTGGEGASAVLECAGTPAALYNALKSVARNGRVSMISLPKETDMTLPARDIVMKQIHFIGSRANPNCSREILDHISRGQLNVGRLITHRFEMEEMAQALKIFSNRLEGVMKVVIHP